MKDEVSISEAEYEDVKKWRKIRSELASLLFPTGKSKTASLDSDLDFEREDVKEIYRYIQEHEGTNKQEVDEASSYSRKRVFKCIKILCSLGHVNERKDPVTNRDYILTINKESLLTFIMSEMRTVEATYFSIIDKLEFMMNDNTEVNVMMLVIYMYTLYRYLFEEYLSRILFEWPSQTKDLLILERGHKLLFSNMSNILSRMQKIFQDPEHAQTVMLHRMKYDMVTTIMSPILIREIMRNAIQLQLTEEVSRLLDLTWDAVIKTHRERSNRIMDTNESPATWISRDQHWQDYLSEKYNKYDLEKRILFGGLS